MRRSLTIMVMFVTIVLMFGHRQQLQHKAFCPASVHAPIRWILVGLDGALDRLGVLDEQQAKVVELRYFAGLTIDETAEVLHISPATVSREWTVAKAWLFGELTGLQRRFDGQ